MPPALPPRNSSQAHPSSATWQGGTAEAAEVDQHVADAKCYPMHEDPRTSSQDSLLPEAGNETQRRMLLLVYIHGFMGNETSFRSFPAHVHNLLTVLIGDSYVVHTKIYPRYRSRGNISIARDNFGKWLEPHETDTTDVILLGHSMGGLLASEVALKPSASSATSPLEHRILGTINFDVPFLGMHPGVVKSGLASVFKPHEETVDRWNDQSEQTSGVSTTNHSDGSSLDGPKRADTLWARQDPNFNPKFANDVTLPVRKGWRNAWHFVNKHSDDLLKSTKKLFASHMEFGGAMANYSELKARYARIRALEEENSAVRSSVLGNGIGRSPARVRFVNYYTASTGRARPPKSPSPGRHRPSSSAAASNTSLSSIDSNTASARRPRSINTSPAVISQDVKLSNENPPPEANDAIEVPLPESGKHGEYSHSKPNMEMPPQESEQAAPVLDHAAREALRLKQEAARMEREARRLRGEDLDPGENIMNVPHIVENAPSMSLSSTADPSIPQDHAMLDVQPVATSTDSGARAKSPKPQKERLFCNLPPKDAQGCVDPCWIRVFMQDMDEVSAHCGLFFVDERYERLVGDVAERIEHWVSLAADERASVKNGRK